MWMICVKAFLFLLCSIAPTLGLEIYQADFTKAGVGASHAGSRPPARGNIAGPNYQIFWNTAPSGDSGGNYFETRGGMLQMRDWGGTAGFQTGIIDVEPYSSVVVTAVGKSVGQGFNATAESFRWWYTLDDGVPIPGPSYGLDGGYQGTIEFLQTLSTEGASALVIGFEFTLNGGADGFNLTTLRVDDRDPIQLSLVFDESVVEENGIVSIATGTVSRSGEMETELQVRLESDSSRDLDLPAVVVLAPGDRQATFTITAIDDTEVEERETIRVVAKAEGALEGVAQITVLSDDQIPPTLFLDPPPTLLEGESAEGLVYLSEKGSMDRTFLLSMEGEGLFIPAEVTILAGEREATFPMTASDNDLPDNDREVTLQITDPSGAYLPGESSVVVRDDEPVETPLIVFNEVRLDQESEMGAADTLEFIELYSPVPNASLNRLSLVIIGDDPSGGSGVIEKIFNLNGESLSGHYLLLGNPDTEPQVTLPLNSLENQDNLTFLLVSDFSGTQLQDLDTDDDGKVDVILPWERVISGVSVVNVPNPEAGESLSEFDEYDYSAVFELEAVGPVSERVGAPYHIYRTADGSGTWQIGAMDPESQEAQDSPGRSQTEGRFSGNKASVRVDRLIVDPRTGRLTFQLSGQVEGQLFDIRGGTDLSRTGEFQSLGEVEIGRTADGELFLTVADSPIQEQGIKKRFFVIDPVPGEGGIQAEGGE